MQSVPITTNVVNSNPVHGEVYSIQHYVIKFVSDFSPGTPVFSTNETDRHDIAEILLKVALNTISLNLQHFKIFLLIILKANSSHIVPRSRLYNQTLISN
jgi:hypothetical protein